VKASWFVVLLGALGSALAVLAMSLPSPIRGIAVGCVVGTAVALAHYSGRRRGYP
jgi:hypothetical protein